MTEDFIVDNDTFDRQSTEIDQDIGNTLDRVVNDYSQHWKGVIGEWFQNAYDGWCHNRFGRKSIPKSQNLHIQIDVDLTKRRVRAGDNAGGMPADTFYHNFSGLDTPGEEKLTGEFGGSYGRGSHVISGAGEEMYAETNHDGFQGGLIIRGARQMKIDPQFNISQEGTVVEVRDVDPEVIADLTDWEQVRRYIQARFNPMLEHDNVTVEYTINGVAHTVEPINFNKFETLWEGDLDFEYGNTEYTLKDVTIYDATSADADVPINGVAMLKSNAHMNKPFMRVQDYQPRQLRHMDKMFGVCDASELCPKFEDNAHNSFTGNITSKTGIKGLLDQLEQEHFIGSPTDLDAKDEIVETTLNIVNEQWDHNPFDTGSVDADSDLADDTPDDDSADNEAVVDKQTETTPDEASDDTDELDGPSDIDEEETDSDGTGDDIDDVDISWAEGDDDTEDETDEEETDEEDEDDDTNDDTDRDTPEITCSTRKRSFATSEDVNVWVFVENPSEYPNTEFTVEAELEHDDTGDVETLDPLSLAVGAGKGSAGDHGWTVDSLETGKYTFRAELIDDAIDDDDDTEDDDAITDTTYTWFWVGRDMADEEQTVETVSFLEDVVLVRSDELDFRAELNEGDRGMILVANTRHPEYRHAVSLDGRTGTKNQKLTLIRWAHEAIMTRLLLDQMDEELADRYSESGDPLSELLGEFVRDNMIEQMSELMAGAHGEV